jgi:hypothetical protein
MTNATLLSGLPILLAWLAWRQWKQAPREAPSRIALATAAIVLCCLPCTIRNYAVVHAFIPLRSSVGLQLWLGNNDQYRDTFPGYLHPIDNSAERAKYVQMGEVAYMQEKQHQAIHWIVSHPSRELKLFKDRFIATWAGTPHPLKDFLRTPSFLIRSVFICNVLAALGALLGTILLYADRNTAGSSFSSGHGFSRATHAQQSKRLQPLRDADSAAAIQHPNLREYAIPVTAFPILFPFASYMSQALFRYRYPIDPIVLLLAAIAVHWLVGRAHKSNRAAAILIYAGV